MTKNQGSLIDLIKTHALKHGDFTLSSGKKSSYYLDVRQVTLHSEGINIIGQIMLDSVHRTFPRIQAVGGMAIGADPIIGALLFYHESVIGGGLAGFIIRKEVKGHGTGKLIEGPVQPGMNVIIVEDVATTGASALAAADAVMAFGCQVRGIIAVVNRREGADEACLARGIPFHALVNIEDLGL